MRVAGEDHGRKECDRGYGYKNIELSYGRFQLALSSKQGSMTKNRNNELPCRVSRKNCRDGCKEHFPVTRLSMKAMGSDSKMTKQIVRNNVVSVAAHLVLCILTIIALGISWSTNNNTDLILKFAVVLLLAIANPLLYFLCGRLFLQNTHNRKSSVLSVAALPVIIVICAIIPTSYMSWVNAPLAPLSSLIAHSLDIIGDLVFALLPSAMLCIGMISKKKSKPAAKQDNAK